jgi:hypothetical protein
MPLVVTTITDPTHPNFGQSTTTGQADAPVAKTIGLRYDEFRKLFTVSELTLLDSASDDAYLTALGKTPLTVTQKADVKFMVSEAIATGAGAGINLASAKMGAALDGLIALGLLVNTRKPEIIAGTVKS